MVIRIAPTDPTVTSGGRYSVAEFLAALRPAAESAIAHTDPLKGGGMAMALDPIPIRFVFELSPLKSLTCSAP